MLANVLVRRMTGVNQQQICIFSQKRIYEGRVPRSYYDVTHTPQTYAIYEFKTIACHERWQMAVILLPCHVMKCCPKYLCGVLL